MRASSRLRELVIIPFAAGPTVQAFQGRAGDLFTRDAGRQHLDLDQLIDVTHAHSS